MATHSSALAWRIPWTEEPSGLQSVGCKRVRHEWATKQQLQQSKWEQGRWLPGLTRASVSRGQGPWALRSGAPDRPEEPGGRAAWTQTRGRTSCRSPRLHGAEGTRSEDLVCQVRDFGFCLGQTGSHWSTFTVQWCGVCVCVCGVNRQEPAALVKTTHHGGSDRVAEP